LPFSQIARHVKAGLIQYEPVEKVTWEEFRENFKEASGIKAKFGVWSEYYHSKRHEGEWSEETKEGKFWSFLIKDLKHGAWKYFGWLLIRKFLLAAIMALTLGAINAGANVLLQVVDVSVLFLLNPFSDNVFNLSEQFGAVSNLFTMILASMPPILGYVPDIFGDFFIICTALMGTLVAAVVAVVGPIVAVASGAWAAVTGCCSAAPVPDLSGGQMKSGSFGNAAQSFRESVQAQVQEMVEDGAEEALDAGGDIDVSVDGGGPDVASAAALGAGGAIGSYPCAGAKDANASALYLSLSDLRLCD